MVRKGLTIPIAAAFMVLLITPLAILGYTMANPDAQLIPEGSDDEVNRTPPGGENEGGSGGTNNGDDGSFSPDGSDSDEGDEELEEIYFNWMPSDPVATKEIRFVLTVDREFSEIRWDFGNGDTASGREVQYAYDESGVYPVNLTVRNSEGDSTWKSSEIEVAEGQKPNPDISYSPTDFRAGDEVYFMAYESSDPDGRVEDYYWDLNGVKRTGSELDHVFESGGSKTIQLTVTDDDGLNATRTASINVEPANKPPEPQLEIVPRNPVVQENVTFNASGSEDQDGQVKSYSWSIDKNFYESGSKAEWRVYDTPGSYEVGLRVEDNENETSTVTKTVNVSANRPPTAQIRHSPSLPKVDQKVSFEAQASDENGDVTSYRWDFDDDGAFEGRGKTETRYFLSPGKKNITLVVTDDQGASNSTKTLIEVLPSGNRPPEPDFSYNVFVPRVGENIVFNGNPSSDPDGTVEGYMWDYGNNGDFNDFGDTVGKTFSSSGDHDVTLRVEDDDGDVAETTETLNLVNQQCEKMSINGRTEDKIDILLVGRNYESSEVMEDHFRYYIDLDQENGGLLDVLPMSNFQDKFNVWMIDNAGGNTISGYGNGMISESREYFESCSFADYNILMSKDSFNHESFSVNDDIFISDVSTRVEQDDGAYGLLHHWGTAFAGLKPEYTNESKVDNPGMPNCAPSKQKAEEWWGGLAESNSNVGYEQGCAYSDDNWEPHPGETIMSEMGRENYGLVNERAILEELQKYD